MKKQSCKILIGEKQMKESAKEISTKVIQLKSNLMKITSLFVVAICMCATTNLLANDLYQNIDITNSCIKSFCGFTFGSPFKEGCGLTNNIIKNQSQNLFSSQAEYLNMTSIIVELKRSFRFCTQAKLEYTPYEMKLCKVTLIGHTSVLMTQKALLEEANKIRIILEKQGHFVMKEKPLMSSSHGRVLRAGRSFYMDSDHQYKEEHKLQRLPFIWENAYYGIGVNAYVNSNGTTFYIVAEDIKTEREDEQKALSARDNLTLDSAYDADIKLLSFDLVPHEQRYKSKEQLQEATMNRISETHKRLLERFCEDKKIIEPLLPFTNAVMRAIENDPSGYYSLALHFAKGDDVECRYSYACLLLEQAVSNHYPNAEFIYALIQIGNSDLANGNDSRWGGGMQWRRDFRHPSVSDAKQKLTCLFNQYTGLTCGTTFFGDIKGIELTNESEVVRLKLSLYDYGRNSGVRMNMSREVISLLDRLVVEKRRNIENTREKQRKEREERTRLEKNEALVMSALGLWSDSPNVINTTRDRSLMRLPKRREATRVTEKDAIEEREAQRQELLRIQEELRQLRFEREQK